MGRMEQLQSGGAVTPRPAALEGEVLELACRPSPCKITEWFAGGWWRWSCIAGDHHAAGEDRTEGGRAAALARHAGHVEEARAAGEMAAYAPVRLS